MPVTLIGSPSFLVSVKVCVSVSKAALSTKVFFKPVTVTGLLSESVKTKVPVAPLSLYVISPFAKTVFVSVDAIVYVVEPSSATVDEIVTFSPCFNSTLLAFNCATLTASVSSLPAATLVIWRVTPLATSPTDTEPMVEVQASPVNVLLLGLYPATPLSTLATELDPKATPSSTVALAL